MTKELRRIPFEEFSDNLSDIFEQLIYNHEAIVVENKYGELVEVKPLTPISSQRSEKDKEDKEAFLSAAGSWSDVDIDEFLRSVYESRRSPRPPIDL